jgi:ribosomal protein S28E/S33
MVDQKLLTAFLAVTALAILIQTGILVGLLFVSNKINRQADKALDLTRNMVGPVHNSVLNVQAATARIAEFSAKAESWLKRKAA